MSIKSNKGLPIPYVLPCFRLRRKGSCSLVILAVAAMLVSMFSSYVAYRTLGSAPIPGHYFLPSAKEWGADRERRKTTRRERKIHSRRRNENETTNIVEYSEYESNLLNFLFSLRAAGVNSAMLPLNEYEPHGQDMGMYANLGCYVFNELNSNVNQSNMTEYHRDRIRRLWSSHIPTILQSSRHADDVSYVHRNWTATILKSLSTYSILNDLRKAMSTKDIERISGILIRRMLGILQHGGKMSSNMPPPLKIAIFGGPTVEGNGCRRANVAIPHGSIMAYPTFCAFPYRLEKFINSLLLPPTVLKQLRITLAGLSLDGGTVTNEEFRLVEVINLAEEGTGTDYSSAIVRNRMYPPSYSNDQSGTIGYGGGPPDLVIDAYGIDYYGKEATTSLSNMYQAGGSRLPSRCLKENRKPSPVVLRVVLEEDTASILTSIVVGDAVDDVEEGELLLPKITNTKGGDDSGSFGMAGHMATSWTIALNLASLAISHCGANGYLPPQRKLPRRNFISPGCDNGIDPPCIFSFLAGPKGNAPRPSAIASSLLPFIVENTGWLPESDMTTGFARKTGLVGTGEGATMTLLFRNITRPMRHLDVVTLRSTSLAWKEGEVQIALVTGGDFSHGKEAAEASAETAKESKFVLTADLTVDGWDDGKEDMHISYHFGLDLVDGENAGQLGSDVLLRMTLTKGNRFKILGLMLCE